MNAAQPPNAGALALVRHGQTDWNAAGKLQGQVDIPLNATGREQARAAAEALRGGGWERVVTSPLGRAAETGAIIAAVLGLPAPTTDAGLIERGYGELEGVVDEELPASTREVLHPDHSRDPGPLEAVGYERGVLPGVERSHAAADRGVEALARIEAAYPGQRVVVVSHGTLIRLTLNALTEWTRFFPSPANAEVNVLDGEQYAAVRRVAARIEAGAEAEDAAAIDASADVG